MVSCFIFQSCFQILRLAVDLGSQSLFWSDTSAEFKGIPYGFMFIFKSGFRILGLAVDFGTHSLFWSGIPYGFMVLFSVWFPNPWNSSRFWEPVFVLVR